MTESKRRICVFAGSNPGRKAEYQSAAVHLGRELNARGYGLVYGGSRVGLMGILADAVLGEGGEVIGVIPQGLVDKEVAYDALPRLEVVSSMHERKKRMFDLSEGFIALPGGLGTLEEFFEVLTWAQLGMHGKPCGLLNAGGYFDSLLHFLDRTVEEGFVVGAHRDIVLVEDSPAALLDRFAGYEAPTVEKWVGRGET